MGLAFMVHAQNSFCPQGSDGKSPHEACRQRHQQQTQALDHPCCHCVSCLDSGPLRLIPRGELSKAWKLAVWGSKFSGHTRGGAPGA